MNLSHEPNTPYIHILLAICLRTVKKLLTVLCKSNRVRIIGSFCMHFKVIGIAHVFTNDLIGLDLDINKKQYLKCTSTNHRY